MSFKDRLFGPRWQHKDASIRLQAVSESNDQQLFEQLSTIAHQDSDSKVRLAALRRLDHETQWLKTSRDDSDDGLRKLADDWLLRAVFESAADERLNERLAWLERIDDNKIIRRIAAEAKDRELRAAALQRIHSQGFLGDCYTSERDDALAAELLQRIDQPSTLKRIAEQLRKSNKNRQQAVLKHLAAIESGADSSAPSNATNALANQLLEQLESLARGGRSDDRAAQIEQIQQQWQQLPSPDDALVRRYQGALRILELAMRPPPEPEPEAVETIVEPNAQLPALADQLQALMSAKADSEDKLTADIEQITTEFDRNWNMLEPSEADQLVKKRFTALTAEHRARKKSQQPKKKEPKKPEHDPVPELIDQLKTALKKTDQAIEAGDVSESQATLSSSQSLFDRIPKKRRPQALAGELMRAHGRMKELRNWQHWSNNEMRERLIERVAEIDAENLHPDAVTARLKELRERWKALDQKEPIIDGKRRYSAPQSLWRKFNQAADEKYQAAKPFLEKRDEVREQALTELTEFLDEAEPLAQNPDSKRDTLIRYQRAARQAMRHLNSLPAKQRGKMAGRLRNLMDSISAVLDKQFDDSEQEKRKLIAEARKISYEKDRDAAIELAKSLQARWKRIPPARRKLDQQLWQEFREPIDPLFEGLKQEREQQQAEDRERIATLEALCKEAEQLANSEEDALDTAAGPIAGLEDQWSQQPAPAGLNKRFNQALDKYQQRLAKRAQQQELEKIAHLNTLTEALQAAWVQRAAGKGVADATETAVPQDDALGQKLQGRLAEFCDSAADDSALSARVEGLTEQARQIVIEMETLSGLETPEGDKKLRMDYQVQRLSERLGQGSNRPDLASERDDLHRRWMESFPHAPDQHQELKKRFEAGDKILKNMTSE